MAWSRYSIVALKRNSRRFQVPISQNGFSLNGCLRNIGRVGQTNLGRSVTRTPFRGPLPMGHGTCCGAYPIIINNSGNCCGSNDPNTIKKSTKNTKGYILSTYKYPTCDNGNCAQGSQENWVKDFSAENNSQGIYIRNIIANYGDCVPNTNSIKNETMPIKPCMTGCIPGQDFIGTKKHFIGAYTKDLGLNNSSSEYIRAPLMRYNGLPTPPCMKEFPMVLIHDGCDVNYLTPDEAIEGGDLPTDWMQPNCSAKYFGCGSVIVP